MNREIDYGPRRPRRNLPAWGRIGPRNFVLVLGSCTARLTANFNNDTGTSYNNGHLGVQNTHITLSVCNVSCACYSGNVQIDCCILWDNTSIRMCPQRRPGRPRTMKYEIELSRKTVGRDFAQHDICNTVRAASSNDGSFPIRASFYESMTREAVWECPVANVTSTVIRWSSCDT